MPITVQVPQVRTRDDLAKSVDDEIKAFESWFIDDLKNTALTPSEAAILRTYLWWKTRAQVPT